MRTTIAILTVATVLLLAVAATAHDKVVVIPLNTGQQDAAPDYGGVQVVTSTTGKVWMDRNLGALRAAIHPYDQDAFGALFQWGRLNDGHAWRNSETTTTLSTTDVPGHGLFILSTTFPRDWQQPQNGRRWRGISGTNNPCPSGFRVPTAAEWTQEMDSWSSDEEHPGFNSRLKLPNAEYRNEFGFIVANKNGLYWTSSTTPPTLFGNEGKYANIGLDRVADGSMSWGMSVRCIKD